VWQQGCKLLLVAASMLSLSMAAASAQGHDPFVVVGYSIPLPGALRGEMTSSGLALGSASLPGRMYVR
jgi:hypothetical protein